MTTIFKPKSISFTTLSQDDALKSSKVEIKSPITFDKFGNSLDNGLHDKRMGPSSSDFSPCLTCGQNYPKCPGHNGHIELKTHLLNPLTEPVLKRFFLRCCCIDCEILKLTDYQKEKLISIYENDENFRKKIRTDSKFPYVVITKYFNNFCPVCKKREQTVKFTVDNKIMIHNSFTKPDFLRSKLKIIYDKYPEIFRVLFGSNDVNMFFMKRVVVIPNRYRPINFMDGSFFESYHNQHLINILKLNILFDKHVQSKHSDNKDSDKETKNGNKKNIKNSNIDIDTIGTDKHTNNIISNMQSALNSYFSSKASGNSGVKEFIEKKDGIFRKNILGKRVNYSGRSVIVPDPNIKTYEVGIPKVFAEKATFPEQVNAHNAADLKNAIINGKNYPGANFLKADGTLINLNYVPLNVRKLYASQLLKGDKIVHRHLKDGDICLLNRQPTFHKPSMMAHKVKILDEKVIRLHYSNCSSYNADFDGDEMNLHFPQTYQSRSEAYDLAMPHANFFNGNFSTLRGLIQDHVIMAALLSSRSVFLSKQEYLNIVSEIEVERLKIEKPCFLRPYKLYSGKKVISSIFLNYNYKINFSRHNKLRKYVPPSEALVLIKDGKFIHGILDKSMVGAANHSLARVIGEVYGFRQAEEFISTLSRVLGKYCKLCGYSISVSDLELSKDMDAIRERILDENLETANERIEELKMDYLAQNPENKNLIENITDYTKIEDGDEKLKTTINTITTEVIANTLVKGNKQAGLYNRFNFIILTGAKGSIVNLSQISGLLGQQELEGKRVAVMENSKTLPGTEGLGIKERGFIKGRFLTGIDDVEYYYHCMAGREGLIDTAVKTANSGYLQRCLVKSLENIYVAYDCTVRENKRIIQFVYGIDGLYRDYYDVRQNISNYDGDYLKNLDKFKAHPGEQVGIIAAQSIGEPSTQMTLNTFHLAGVGAKNVTLGVPRLKEILIGATKTKIEVLTLKGAENIKILFEPFARKNLKDILKKLKIKEIETENEKVYKFTFEFSEGITAVEHRKLKRNFVKVFSKKFNTSDANNLNISSLEDKESDKNKETSYKGNKKATKDEDEASSSDSDSKTEKSNSIEDDEEESSNSELKSDFEEENVGNNFVKIDSENLIENDLNLREKITITIPIPNSSNMLIVPIVEEVIENITVRDFGINEINFVENKLYFIGSSYDAILNVFSMLGEKILPLDINNVASNDVKSTIDFLGIEAARTVILEEVGNVFDAYGIKIDYRHLWVVADFMTYTGKYVGMNRHGMNYDIFKKLSFESAYVGLMNSACFEQKDEFYSHSARVGLGMEMKGGTGMFDLEYDIS